MNKYKDQFFQIEKNKQCFEYLLDNIKEDNDLSINMCIAQTALSYAVNRCTGYFYSKKLEKFYIDLSNTFDVLINDIDVQVNSFLHVMTTCYVTGGHTRVVERWIENANLLQKHSVVLIDQGENEVPEILKKNVKDKNGDLVIFDHYTSQIEKGLELRKLGMHYDYIVLHIHMDDPVATIAFGNKNFNRPVIFFNHADHLFWIGKSISDVVVDFKTKISISKSRRLLNNIYKLPIPVDIRKNTDSKINCRKKLNIALNEKIILTVGSNYKYNPVLNDNTFFELLNDVLLKNSYAMLYVIGPDINDKNWSKIKRKFNNRIILLGYISYDSGYLDYIKASDVLIDSYPVGGGTVCIDAITNNLPFVSLNNFPGNIDSVVNSVGLCDNKLDAIHKISNILQYSNYSDFVLNDEKVFFYRDSSKISWDQYLCKILADTKHHVVKDINEEVEPVLIDDYCVFLNEIYKNTIDVVYIDKFGICLKKIGIPYLFEKRKYRTRYGFVSLFVIFGFKIKYKIVRDNQFL